MGDGPAPRTGAESLLMGLKRAGVEYLFGNAGTDFPPLIEAMARLPADAVPVPVTVPHETAAMAMAHGHYLATGRAQAVMVHTNVGLANAMMGMINCASDDVPVIVMSGRTPITETGRPGGRVSPIQYGQEMYDQAAMVAEIVKHHYEMRFPEQGGPLAGRAMALATSAPAGPVYLSLPREVLMEPVPEGAGLDSPRPAARPAHPDPEAIGRLAAWLMAAKAPLILAQRGDPAGHLGAALAGFAEAHGVPVAEPFPLRNLMPSAHPMFAGHQAAEAIREADLIVVLDCAVPWIEAISPPGPDCRLVHIGPDPHFRRMPARFYRTDLAIEADPLAAIRALGAALPAPGSEAGARRADWAARGEDRRAAARAKAKAGATEPMSAEWLSLCLSEALGPDAAVFSELGALPGFMAFAGPNRFLNNVHAGGLGWGMGAALGAQLADRERLVVACIGDGSYLFANPPVCHQIAEALELPILTVVKNNGMWNAVRRSVLGAYPDGAAARANAMPLTSLEPAPDYGMIAAASRAHVERVSHGRDLPAALARAIRVIREERRQAFVELRVAVADIH